MYDLRYDDCSLVVTVDVDCEIDQGLESPMFVCESDVAIYTSAWSDWNVRKSGTHFSSGAQGFFRMHVVLGGNLETEEYGIESWVEHHCDPSEDDLAQDAMSESGYFTGGVTNIAARTVSLTFELQGIVAQSITRADMTIGAQAAGSFGTIITAWAGNPPQLQTIENTSFNELILGG